MDILTTLYMTTGFIFALGFIPQIITVWKDHSGAIAINLTTCALFTICTFISFLYVWLKTGDSYIMLATGMCAIGNSAVLILATKRRLELYARIHVE